MRNHGLAAALLALSSLPGIAAAQPYSFDNYPTKTAPDADKTEVEDTGYPIYPSGSRVGTRARPHQDPERKASSGWEFTDNPDRYPSITFQQSGAETVNGHQNTYVGSVNDNRSVRSFALNSLINAILPLSDRWSLVLSGGLNVTEFTDVQSPTATAVVNDNSASVYVAGLRYFFVGHSTIWGAAKNPDRWPSTGLQVTGTSTVQYDVTGSVNGINQPFYARSWRVDNENRMPLTDGYTLVATLSGVYSRQETGEVPSLAGGSSHLKSIGGALEHRFYLVDRNLLFNDEGRNPDRWSSVYIGGGALASVAGDQTSQSLGKVTTRYNSARTFNAALGVRLPMTSRATFRLEMNYTDQTTHVPETLTEAHSQTRTSQLGALTSFRYYCF